MTPTLLPHHLHELEVGSGISPEVIAQRGYFSATTADELIALGFADYQALPGLVAPRYNLAGRLDGYLLKPDKPRIDPKTGKPIKYENPHGTYPDLDILPEDLPRLKDTDEEVWIVEGHKKADALRSRGKLAISITGTFMYLRGRVVVPALDEIPLNGRQVIAGYDSDVAVKEGVELAELRLAAAFDRRDAKVSTLRLPAGPDGEKWGVDDALVAGWSVDDLRTHTRRWDRTGPNIRIHDPYAGQDLLAVIAEQAATISALCGLIRNPNLTDTEKVAAVQVVTLTIDRVAEGKVEPDGTVELSPADIAEDFRAQPDRGTPTPAVDKFGNKPLMSRKSATPAMEKAIERDLVKATPVKVQRSHRSGAKYEATSWRVTPPTSMAEALSPWATWCPEEPKLRKPRVTSKPCLHCGEIHPIQRRDTCTGCGGFTDRTIQPVEAVASPPESPGEIISPDRNDDIASPSPPHSTYREKKFPRAAVAPDLADLQADLDVASHVEDPAAARIVLDGLESDLAGIARQRGRSPAPKPKRAVAFSGLANAEPTPLDPWTDVAYGRTAP